MTRLVASVLALIATLCLPSAALGNQATPEQQDQIQALGEMRLGFVRQDGGGFHAGAPSAGFSATPEGMRIGIVHGESARSEELTLKFAGGARPDPEIDVSERLEGAVHDFTQDVDAPARARYGTLTYRDVWPGIDVRFRGKGGVLKYEFLVSEDARPRDIKLKWKGVGAPRLTADGELALRGNEGRLIDQQPVSYSGWGDDRRELPTRYLLDGKRFGFAVGGNRADGPLVVDPGLEWWSYVGGGSQDLGHDVAIDAQGSVYIAGVTASADFPSPEDASRAAKPGYDQGLNGVSQSDAFLVKLDTEADGDASLEWWSYVGGSSFDQATGVAVDGQGDAYLTGLTDSTNFPSPDDSSRLAKPGYDQSSNSAFDGFLVKLDTEADGDASLEWWSYVGGSAGDSARGVAVDGAGNAYVAGDTSSTNFPSPEDSSRLAKPGYDQSFNGVDDAFLIKLDTEADGAASLEWWSYVGGGTTDHGTDVALDAQGNTYLAGYVASADFPSPEDASRLTKPGYDQSHNGGFDAFLVKLDTEADGESSLAWWTYAGGGQNDRGNALAIDGQGEADLGGSTESADFPSPEDGSRLTKPGYDQSHNGGSDAFLVQLDTAEDGAATVRWWSYLGGGLNEFGSAIAVDGDRDAYLAGSTESADFPSPEDGSRLAKPGYDQSLNGEFDAFLVKLAIETDSDTSLAWWSYLGGRRSDIGGGVAVDAQHNVYVTGSTASPGFPSQEDTVRLAKPGYDQSLNGDNDAFLVKLDTTEGPPPGDPFCFGEAESGAPTADDDVLVGTNSADLINGLEGDDRICGLPGDDSLQGNAGDDSVRGGNGDDDVAGEAGNDTLYGGLDEDVLRGAGQDDYVNGQNGADLVQGGRGNDRLFGGSGPDRLRAAGGFDVCTGNAGVDTFQGCELITDGPT